MGNILETASNFAIKRKYLKWARTICPPLVVGLQMNVIELLGVCILIHKAMSIASMSLRICKEASKIRWRSNGSMDFDNSYPLLKYHQTKHDRCWAQTAYSKVSLFLALELSNVIKA